MNLPKDIIVSWFPISRKRDISDDELHTLVALEMQFEEIDGRMTVSRNGKVVRDPVTHLPIKPEKVIQDYFEERQWIPGRKTPSEIKTFSEFQNHWKEQHPDGNTLSPDFHNDLNAHTKTVENFDFYS